MGFFKKKSKVGYKIENHPDRKDCIHIVLLGTGLDMDNPVHLECMQVILKDNIQEMYAVGHNLPKDDIKIQN